ncbi:hypothetical protein BDR07DRAFT_1493257 [Suillus spraguei]|nr:hypothetical protein BDR07DRAFT_1493257 [Suillus spraguei]
MTTAPSVHLFPISHAALASLSAFTAASPSAIPSSSVSLAQTIGTIVDILAGVDDALHISVIFIAFALRSPISYSSDISSLTLSQSASQQHDGPSRGTSQEGVVPDRHSFNGHQEVTITIPPAHVISELTMPTGVRSLPSKQISSATPLLVQHSSGRDSEFLDMRLRNILCEMYNAEMCSEGRKVERLTGIVRTSCDAIGSGALPFPLLVHCHVLTHAHSITDTNPRTPPSPSPSPVPPSPIPSEHSPNIFITSPHPHPLRTHTRIHALPRILTPLTPIAKATPNPPPTQSPPLSPHAQHPQYALHTSTPSPTSSEFSAFGRHGRQPTITLTPTPNAARRTFGMLL